MRRNGFSLVEVIMALVILGIVSSIFFQSSRYAGRNQGKTRSWEAEAAVVEKAVEGLRVGYSMTQLQQLNTSWIDSSQGGRKFYVKATGKTPDGTTVPSADLQKLLAEVTVVVRGLNDSDSLSITNVMWVN